MDASEILQMFHAIEKQLQAIVERLDRLEGPIPLEPKWARDRPLSVTKPDWPPDVQKDVFQATGQLQDED